ncbi:MAG TPA: hypothetical protein VI546_06595 [candidate division Zixibacteria bacterium]|nr:hypothetical protein [candidate division Zixibacteria bacterium]
MKTVLLEEREIKVQRKNRRLGVVLTVLALAVMTTSYLLMKVFHFVPLPPK